MATYPFAPNVLRNLAAGNGTNHGAHVGERSEYRELQKPRQKSKIRIQIQIQLNNR